MTPGQENLEIHYTGLNWNRPQAIKFRFRLVGLDRDWVDAGARRTAYYSHLPAGTYTFTVIADNGDGVWNATGKTLRDRRPAASLPDRVVPRRGRRGPGGAGVAVVAVSHGGRCGADRRRNRRSRVS